MELNEYQEKAMTTCMESSRNVSYMLLNLVGEVGEFASKIAKGIRKGKIIINENDMLPPSQTGLVGSDYKDLKAELGDILWQVSGLCEVMGWKLEEVANTNLAKLAGRKQNGNIDGNGDNR